jgi:uncharacterized protein (DUF486 family)
MPVFSPYLTPIMLLIGSNVFMTTAWYWHLRYKEVPLSYVVLISWGLAFVEYWLAVPANRYGSAVYNAAQLKTIQEVITFAVFAVFSFVYLREPITLSQGFGFALITVGAFFVFHKW